MSSGFTLVDEPLIEYVIDQADGKEYRAGEYVFASAREIAEIRMRVFDAIKREEPNIICAACHTPAYPRKHIDTGKFHFVHVSEDGENDCPYNEKRKRVDTTRIDSMRYNGQKEGPDHKLLKNILRSSIDADPLFDPAQTREEKNWYGATDEKKWRRPDIAATRLFADDNSLRIAFEIQLSSTYLKVIAARREFYLKENALLFWVFKDASGVDPRQYQDDLFYNNNSNLFVVDEETGRFSQEHGKLIFRCCYYEPVLVGASVIDEWRERVVSFDELTFDVEHQRVYWFDYKAEKAKLLETAGKKIWEREEEELRARYEDFWNNIHLRKCKDPETEYRRLRQQLLMHDITVPERHDRELERFTQMVYSAKAGEGFLTGLKTLLELANNSYLYGKQFLWYFGRVLQHYGTWDTLLAQDKNAEQRKKMSGKKHESWKEKGKTIKQKIDANDPDFKQNRSYDKLFLLLFPEITLPE
ncbi:hypothetical protein OR1_00648 [Geobacter sp. OR-1]|uniref:DUF6035 family protein n=1 Tax=Geobacter sp. OR-1 TaxID=1266765 RepID=UPI000541DD3C|nr:DUF6035 family protein [Geobacter sp. OR-1]GAM08377.1 hypothetical protein OR1_00648 [Geobacter sp. OR-1]